MKSTLETVAFFKNIRETLDEMSDEDAGALMKALFAHDAGETVDLSQKSTIVRVVYPMIVQSYDRLKAIRTARTEAGRSGGLAKSSKPVANDKQTVAHNHNHSHDHVLSIAPVKKNSFFDFDQRKPGDPGYKDLDKIVRGEQ